jgi:hypothetical protein
MTKSRWLLLALLSWSLPWLAVELALLGPDLWVVLTDGMCPSGPPDVSAYPCTVPEYLLRMFLGPFAFIGQVMLTGAWSILWACGALGVAGVRALLGRRAL